MSVIAAPSTHNPVATTTQALNDDSFAPFADVNGAGNAAGQSARNGTAQCVAAVRFTECSTDTRAQDGRGDRILIELFLGTGEGLTRRQVRLIGAVR